MKNAIELETQIVKRHTKSMGMTPEDYQEVLSAIDRVKQTKCWRDGFGSFNQWRFSLGWYDLRVELAERELCSTTN